VAGWQKAAVVPQRIPDLEGSKPAETSSDGAAPLALRLARAGHAGSVSQAGVGRHFLARPPAACAPGGVALHWAAGSPRPAVRP